MANERKSLGRGLGSIISGGVAKKPEARPSQKIQAKEGAPSREQNTAFGLFTEIAADKIIPSPYQPRKGFSEDDIASLADSIASEGLLQPIILRKIEGGAYQIIAGERRFRACKKLGLKKIPACVQSASDASAAAKCLIENLQRSDLNPIEEAAGISSLIGNFKLTQEAAANRLGKPRSTIANALRLLTLPKEVQNYISSGLLTQGHAKVILSVDGKEAKLLLARKIIEKGLNIRAAEAAAKNLKNEREGSMRAAKPAAQSAVIRDLQKKVSAKLNASVEIRHGAKKGKIIIEYAGNGDLQRILEIVGVRA
ncbi:MAG: ParB/RepB/Spo0J family partition protein [Opitutales bacterium]|nr:ParB/RepB/Spo0J family partition protein [Opitutales bacterium]